MTTQHTPTVIALEIYNQKTFETVAKAIEDQWGKRNPEIEVVTEDVCGSILSDNFMENYVTQRKALQERWESLVKPTDYPRLLLLKGGWAKYLYMHGERFSEFPYLYEMEKRYASGFLKVDHAVLCNEHISINDLYLQSLDPDTQTMKEVTVPDHGGRLSLFSERFYSASVTWSGLGIKGSDILVLDVFNTPEFMWGDHYWDMYKDLKEYD